MGQDVKHLVSHEADVKQKSQATILKLHVTTMAAINASQIEPSQLLVTTTPTKAPNMKISPCAIFNIPNTPKTSVNPRATIA